MADIQLEPYAEAIDEFPITGTATEKLRAAVGYAVRAPSSHNSQPWRFVIRHETLELHADRTRRLPVVDPEGRELVISCGAALFIVQLALRRFGCAPRVQRFPDTTDPDLLARVWIDGAWERSATDEALFRAIAARHTSRSPCLDRSVPESLAGTLEAAAREERAWLHVFHTDAARAATARLVAEADRRQLADKSFRCELAAWLRPNWSTASDGIPGYALGHGPVRSAVEPLVVRTVDVGRSAAARDEDLLAGSPLLGVIGTRWDTAADWLNAGEALAHVLLRAQVDGVSASFLNQPIEVPALRPRVLRLAGKRGFPQLLLRFGFAPPRQATPRRPVADVLTE